LNLNRCWHICVDTDREKFLQRSAIVAATSPTVIFPSVTAITKLLSAAECGLSHSIDSVQPPTIYTAGCRLGKRQYSDTTAIITIKIAIPSTVSPHVQQISWFVRWAVCWPARSVRVCIWITLTHVQTKVRDIDIFQ
jgi:hypothetical protein